MIGQSLEEIRKDLRLMPTPALMQYKQNPGKQAIDGVPLDMLAGLELSRRAELQQAQMARMAPNAQMPSVVDQKAMGLMSGMQQPAVNPAMPGQPPQFAAQQAPAPAPQPAPQQMAQASEPQGMQMPMQPTQQQPKKLAVGGIASLGDMQDARDQGGGLFAPGMPPVARMARGGIVAFADNKDQPVDPDMPAEDNRSQFRKDIGSFVESLKETPEQEEWRKFVQKQQMAGAPIQYFLSSSDEYKQNKEISNFIKDNPEAFKDPANRSAFMQDPRAFMSSYQKPGAPKPVPVPAPGQEEKQPEIKNVPDTDLASLMKQFGGKFELPPRSKEEQSAIDEANAVLKDVKGLKSPEVPEADRERIIEEQFKKNQASTEPYYREIKNMLAQEREATKGRREDAASNARLRLGLGLWGSRAPTFGEGLKEAGIPALDAYERSEELLAQADAKNRQAEMDLMRARMADEKGDRKAAQDYFDSYQRNKREAYAAQVSSMNLRVQAAKVPADIANREERLGMQMQNLGLRQQLGLANIAARMQGSSQPTISEVTQINNARDKAFAPGSPTAIKYFGMLPGGDRVVADIKAGRLKPGMPEYERALNDAQKIWYRDTYGGARRGGTGVTSYNQAATDLGVE